MDIEFAILALDIDVSEHNLLTMDHGDMQYIIVEQLPILDYEVSLVIKARAQPNEVNNPHTYRIQLFAPGEEKPRVSFTDMFVVPPHLYDRSLTSATRIFTRIDRIKLDKPGEYRFRMSLAGSRIVEIPVYVHVGGRSIEPNPGGVALAA